jgi:hypothetical protein
LCILAVALLAPPAAAQPGWGAARFGMDMAALDAAFGGALRPLDPPLRYGDLLVSRYQRGVDVAGIAFTALFQADAQGHLQRVLLERRRPTPRQKADVAAKLRSVLGPPTLVCASSVARQTVWRRAGRTVYLTTLDFDEASLLREDPNSDRDILEPLGPRRRNDPRQMPQRLLIRYAPAGAPDDCPR